MSRKNGKHLSSNQMKVTLIENGISAADAIKLVSIIDVYSFNMLDGLSKAINIIKKGEVSK